MFEEATNEIYSIIVFGFVFIYFMKNKNGWLHKHTSTLNSSMILLKKIAFYFVLCFSGFFLFVSIFDFLIVIAKQFTN